MDTYAFSTNSLEELDRSLAKCVEDRFTPSLAIGFCSPDFPFEEATRTFKDRNISLIGCTTAGEIINESLRSESMVVLLMDMNPEYFQMVQFEHENGQTVSSGHRLAIETQQAFSRPALLVFISGVGVSADGVIDGLKENLKQEVPIYGGLAGDDLQQTQTHTFTHEGVCSSGVAALILNSEKIEVKGLAVSGWKPLGKMHTVTRSENNIIYEIDNQPALDLFLKYFGEIKYKYEEHSDARTIPGQYPLKIWREDGSSFLRSLLIYDTQNRALIAAGKIPTGVDFEFCPTPELEVVEKTIDAFEDYAASQPEVDASIMISCKGRHTSFGPFLEDEIKAVFEIWNAPMVGLLAYGEIGNTKKDSPCEFQNVTCSLVNLREI